MTEELEGESLEKWTSCVDRLKELGFEPEKAEQIVGQAFGWGRQAYWLNKKNNEVPEIEKVMHHLIFSSVLFESFMPEVALLCR